MQLLVPSTYGLDHRDDKLKVTAYGRLARAAAIFGVEQITIYRDDDPKADEARNAELLRKHLEYAECPPYLRKELIPHDPDLEYASILPALQTLSHGYTDEFREAAVTDADGGTATLDAGLDDPVTVDTPLEEGARVTLMRDGDTWTVVDRDAIDGFWTFTVTERRDALGDVIDDLPVPVIGTARQGDPVSDFRDSRFVDEDVAIAFGSAWRGLPALIERGDLTADQLTGIYNFIPAQHTKTVRTDEAVPIVLGIFNALRTR